MALAAIILVPGYRDALDGVGEVLDAGRAGAVPAVAGRRRRARREPDLRAHSRALSRAKGSLTRAAFLSARNDAFANVAIIAAGLVTALTLSAWPDLIVGLAIAAMNADAAREVWEAARGEAQAAA